MVNRQIKAVSSTKIRIQPLFDACFDPFAGQVHGTPSTIRPVNQ